MSFFLRRLLAPITNFYTFDVRAGLQGTVAYAGGGHWGHVPESDERRKRKK